jgi:hypothetical protein
LCFVPDRFGCLLGQYFYRDRKLVSLCVFHCAASAVGRVLDVVVVAVMLLLHLILLLLCRHSYTALLLLLLLILLLPLLLLRTSWREVP